MKKRLLSLLLVASLTAGMISGVAFAADENEAPAEEELVVAEGEQSNAVPVIVKSIDITAPQIKEGDTPSSLINNIKCTAKDADGNVIPAGVVEFGDDYVSYAYETFSMDAPGITVWSYDSPAGTEGYYGFNLYYYIMPGYTEDYQFADTIACTVNGSTESILFSTIAGDGSFLVAYAMAPKALVISKIDVTVDEPAKGMTLADMSGSVTYKAYDADNKELSAAEVAYALDESAGYMYSTFDYNDYVSMEPMETIQKTGKYYGLDAIFVAGNGYKFAEECQVTVNGSTDSVFVEEVMCFSLDDGKDGFLLPFALYLEKDPEEAPDYLYLDIPYTIIVKKGGDIAPPAVTEEIKLLEIEDTLADYITLSGNKVKITGEGTYSGMIHVALDSTRPASDLYRVFNDIIYNEDSDSYYTASALFGIFAPGEKWTIDGANAYTVMIEEWKKEFMAAPKSSAKESITVGSEEEEWGGVYTLTCNGLKVDDLNNLESTDYELEAEDVDRLTFKLVYTDNKKAEPKPDKPSKKDPVKKYTSPATGDTNSSFAWIIVMVAAVVGAAGVVIFRRVRR